MTDAISRLRRFQRAVTSEIGLLDTSFLGRGRPLGPARVLNAIGGGRTEVSELRAYLQLDSGLMSRLLRALEAEDLIELEAGSDDSRRRTVRLTLAGETEYAAYETLANERANALLSRHPNPDQLLTAMDLIASAMGRDRITFEQVDPRDERALECLQAYYTELARRLSQGFEVTRSADPEASDMRSPRGSFFIALSDGLPLGCVGLKGTDKGYSEVKRLWIAPAARGLGLSRRLMAELERIATATGVGVLRLDTNSALPEALALYRNSGWTEIERFNDDPYPDFFFEKRLTTA